MTRKLKVKVLTILSAMLLSTVLLQEVAPLTEDDDHDRPFTSTAGLFDVTIHVTNELSGGMALILHCRSGDDDLRGRVLEANVTYEFKFGVTLGTLFRCKAAFRDRRLSFVAFEEVMFRDTYVERFYVSDGGVDGLDIYRGDRVHVCDWN